MAFATVGTLSTLDTMKSNFQNIAQYGEDRAFEDFERLRAAHNRMVDDMLGDLVEKTTDRFVRYGSAVLMAMEEQDEYGTPHPQKARGGSNVGFPLRSFQCGLQWNRKYMENATVAEFAAQITAIFTADITNVGIQIKKSLLTGTNYIWNDYLVDNLQSGAELPIKALANADGAEIPVGPNGESFDGTTHTHYLFAATMTNASLVALLDTVVEHFASGQPMLYLNKAQESTIRGYTGTSGDFTPYLDARITGETTSRQILGASLTPTNVYNRPIGVFRGAEVWIKPWVPANYQVAFLRGQAAPLRLRERRVGSGVLALVADDESYPLRAKMYEREFGVGVYNRINAAVNYSNSGSAYAAPTITTTLA